MKKMIIAGVWLFVAGIANAQTFEEWFRQKETQINYLKEQIGALKAYGEVVNKGYDIAHHGLTNIFDSKDDEYRIHNSYFISLWKVKPGIKTYSKVTAIFKMKADIEKQYRFIKSPPPVLNDKEKEYINTVFLNLLDNCNDLTQELEMVTTDDHLQLKDDERIDRIHKLYLQMQDLYEFSRSFSSQVKLLVINRLKESSENGQLSRLYEIK